MPQNQPQIEGAASAAPPWQAPAQPRMGRTRRGPAWGGVGESGRARGVPLEGQEWDAVRGAATGAKLEPSWHMVRRGLALLPFSLAVVFAVFGVTGIVLLFDLPVSVSEMVLLISVPAIIFTGVLVTIGGAMCCLVPFQSGARLLALAAAGCLASFLVFLLTMGVSKLAGTSTTGSGGLFMTLAYLPTLLLLLAGCVVFLLFGRAVAIHLNHRTGAILLFFAAIFLGISPVVLGILVGLVKMTSTAVGGQGQGKDIIINLIMYVIVAVDLFWFLLVARDVRRAVLRGFVTTAV